MAQQQLLLIALAIIVIAVAVVIGVTMFTDQAVSANRDAVSNDLLNLAARAQQYYRRPTTLGGGGSSFAGLTADAAGLAKITNLPVNANGAYSIVTSGTSSEVVIQGVGTESTFGGRRVTLQIHVRSEDQADSLVQVY